MAGGSNLDIEVLYHEHRVRIFRSIAGVVLDIDAAEDLTQETFEQAWRARRSYRGAPDAVGAWLYRIAMNRAISWLRRQRLAKLLPALLSSRDEGGIEGFEGVENRQLTDIALAALSPRQRVVVVMTYYSGLTRREVAAALGVPAGTVASRLDTAQRLMRTALQKEAWRSRRAPEESARA